MKLLFSIYTNKNGHQVIGFDSFDKNGRSAFNQAIDYATTTFNDDNDVPRVYLLSEVPIEHDKIVRTPAEWEAILNVEVIDADGWRYGSSLGVKSLVEPITRDEFKTRMNESTIREGDLKKI